VSAFLGERSVKAAQKSHECHWCGEEICMGVSYVRGAGVYGGSFSTWTLHAECASARDRHLDYESNKWGGTCEWEFWDHARGLADYERPEEVQP
jgi:hypothetical protein